MGLDLIVEHQIKYKKLWFKEINSCNTLKKDILNKILCYLYKKPIVRLKYRFQIKNVKSENTNSNK